MLWNICMDCIGPPDNDDEIREEYIGRHRVHFLGRHLPVPVLKVMTRNNDADAREKDGHDGRDHQMASKKPRGWPHATSTWLVS